MESGDIIDDNDSPADGDDQLPKAAAGAKAKKSLPRKDLEPSSTQALDREEESEKKGQGQRVPVLTPDASMVSLLEVFQDH